MKAAEEWQWTAPKIAALFGVSRQAVSGWACPSRKLKRRGRMTKVYDPRAVVQWRFDELESKVREDAGVESMQDPLVREKRELEVQLKALTLGKECGLLVQRDEVEQQFFKLMEILRTSLEGMGPQMANRLEGQDAGHISALLTRKSDELLESIRTAFETGEEDTE